MTDDTNLKAKTIEALRQYREALANVEDLEQQEACARRALTGVLTDIERAILEDCASSVRETLFRAGQAATSRLSEASHELTEATKQLDAAGRAFAALEKQLGYIPVVPTTGVFSKELENATNRA